MFEPRRIPQEHLREDGIRYINDLTYGGQYPNSHLDIWLSNLDGSHPTVMYWHGGGFLFGDKVSGDPLATKTDGDSSVLMALLRYGYNVVNVNYALAPEYRHPVQMQQMNDAIAFCMDHSEKYSLDMEHVFLMGGSAGAIMVEMYGLAMVNAEYAEKLGFRAVLPEFRLCGLLIDESVTDYRNFDDPKLKWMLGSWIGTNHLCRSPKSITLDVPSHITEKYPPCFINASNMEPVFYTSALSLKHKLDEIGMTDYEMFFRDGTYDQLEHGYMQRMNTNPQAKECFDTMITFMRKHY